MMFEDLVSYVTYCLSDNIKFNKDILKPLVEEALKEKISKNTQIDFLTNVPITLIYVDLYHDDEMIEYKEKIINHIILDMIKNQN